MCERRPTTHGGICSLSPLSKHVRPLLKLDPVDLGKGPAPRDLANLFPVDVARPLRRPGQHVGHHVLVSPLLLLLLLSLLRGFRGWRGHGRLRLLLLLPDLRGGWGGVGGSGIDLHGGGIGGRRSGGGGGLRLVVLLLVLSGLLVLALAGDNFIVALGAAVSGGVTSLGVCRAAREREVEP